MSQPAPQTSDSSPRMTADERRLQLIEVAIDLFSRRGFSGTTTKEIAAAAGVTEAIIFRHFATKQQLYTAILDYRLQTPGSECWMSELHALMERNEDEAVFRHIVSVIILIHREDARFERLMLYAALEGHELAAMYQQRLAKPFGDMLHRYLLRRQEEGALVKVHPDAAIFALGGMSQYYGMHKHLFNYRDIQMNDEEAAEAFTRILMKGMQSESGAKS